MTLPCSSSPSRGCVYQIEDLAKDYDGGRIQALRSVNLTIHEGDFVSILGRSGCGKSTLLQMLGTLEEPSRGSFSYRGSAVDGNFDSCAYRSRDIGFIFQSFHLLPTFTALENVLMPMLATRTTQRERMGRATELLHAVGLRERLNHMPSKLSGGERQRVAIARSLANQPRVLLADEPTGNLDSESGNDVMELLSRIHREQGLTVLVVTHDPVVAAFTRREIRMKDGMVVSDTVRGGSGL